MTGQDWLEKDFYAVLGVPKTADDAAIKKAYRKLARIHHPDANGGAPASEKRFKEVGEAYAVLSDTEQRQQYDAVRAMGGGARFTAGSPGGSTGPGFDDLLGNLFGGGGRGNSSRVRFTTAGDGAGGRPSGGSEYEDLLSEILRNSTAGGTGGFGGGGPGGFGRTAGSRGRDVETTVKIGLRQALAGTQVRLGVTEQGSAQRTVTARIPAGVRDGQKLRLRGKGATGPGGAGDVVVTIQVESDPTFAWDGTVLRVTAPITFAEAALGADIDVPTLDGVARLRVPPGTPSGRAFRVRGRGPVIKGAPADLLVAVQVVVPQRLSAEAKAAVETLAKLEAGLNPRADLLAAAEAGRGAGRESA